MPKLSIVTVNLDNVNGLRKTIESVINQTLSDYEYIIIDGGSNDGSVDVINEYADKITYWESKPDKGIYNAMNKGLKQATGDIVTFLNSGDNYCSPSSLETTVQCIKDKFSCAELFFFDYINQSDTSDRLISSSDVINKFIISKKGFGHPSTFYKRSLFGFMGLFDERFKISADRAFYMEAIVKNRVAYAYFPFTISVFHDGGLSTDYKNKNIIREEERIIIDTYYSGFEKMIVKNRVFRKLLSIKILNNFFLTLLSWKLNRT